GCGEIILKPFLLVAGAPNTGYFLVCSGDRKPKPRQGAAGKGY
ncbi:MAG: hypothetical protein K0S78_4341, partial [Thermomicrobiales bacterium]|nr:hypothetical protein [Thermomicrobiales bacterium]